jgi:hypothetical protein
MYQKSLGAAEPFGVGKQLNSSATANLFDLYQ